MPRTTITTIASLVALMTTSARHTAVAIALWVIAPTVWGNESRLLPLDSFPRAELSIATPDARLHRFDVWLAADDAHRAQGLMYVKSLPDKKGMLFIYGAPQPITMWMKNTLIPLDMLFIRADGRVARIAANTKPLSLKHIGSQEAVVAVLELNGGAAARLNIKPGAVVLPIPGALSFSPATTQTTTKPRPTQPSTQR